MGASKSKEIPNYKVYVDMETARKNHIPDYKEQKFKEDRQLMEVNATLENAIKQREEQIAVLKKNVNKNNEKVRKRFDPCSCCLGCPEWCHSAPCAIGYMGFLPAGGLFGSIFGAMFGLEAAGLSGCCLLCAGFTVGTCGFSLAVATGCGCLYCVAKAAEKVKERDYQKNKRPLCCDDNADKAIVRAANMQKNLIITGDYDLTYMHDVDVIFKEIERQKNQPPPGYQEPELPSYDSDIYQPVKQVIY